jgi:SAM-dependent methyltransferase
VKKTPDPFYSTDLAHIHDAGFREFAVRVAPELHRILRAHGIGMGRIVEVGCGGGLVARYLSDRGYDVRGIDVSPAMIAIARATAPGARFRVASLMDARLPACDAIVGIGEVLTYVPGGLPALRRFFLRAHAALRDGGILIFDFLHTARGRTYPAKTMSGTGWSIAVRAHVDPSGRTLTRRMAIVRSTEGRTRRSHETHRVRIYGRQPLAAVLSRCGFEVQMAAHFGRLRLIAGDTAVVARKTGRI